MNFKKLGSVLAKRKMLILAIDASGTQWAGDDISMYELSGLPQFSVDTLLFTFGVNLAKKDTWLLQEDAFPVTFDTSPELQTDLPVIIDDNAIGFHGNTFRLLHAADKCFVLPERYLLPVYNDQMNLFLRTMPATGEPKIIAREGLFVTAIFEPLRASAEMQEWLDKTAISVK